MTQDIFWQNWTSKLNESLAELNGAPIDDLSKDQVSNILQTAVASIEQVRSKALVNENNVVGLEEKITFPTFNKTLTAKVDTGASTSCLHATNIAVDKSSNTVTFSCPGLSNNQIKLPLTSMVDVRSADHGSDARPVVELDVIFGGKDFPKAKFNLNDRSAMDSMVLVGEDLLSGGEFLIKPTTSESVEAASVAVDLNKVEDSLREHTAAVKYDPATGKCVIELDMSGLLVK